ncbi:MAG: hypothetical protein HKL89_05805, partial [Candidatus Dormibacteraeota bacterium]|nr:hypothetical protein [Candidatus Dormibacteraeota bacterium]
MRIFPGGGSGSVRRGGLRRAIGTPAAVAGLIGGVGLAVWLGVLAGPVSAAPTNICTWSSSSSKDLTDNANWTPTSGTCGNGSGAGTAVLTDAQLVFPSPVPGSGSTLSLGSTAESPDDVVFQTTYTIGGTGALTLSGKANSGIGLAVTAGTPVISAPVALAAGQTFDAAGATSVTLSGPVSGAVSGTYALTVNDASNAGDVILSGSVANGGSTALGLTLSAGSLKLSGTNTFSGATTVDGPGTLYLDSADALSGTSGVTVEDNGTLSLDTASVTYVESLTLGSAAGAGTLQVGSGGTHTWSGPISLVASPTPDVFYTPNGPLTVAGVISGGGSLMADGGPTLTLDAQNTYTGTTEVASTVADGVANALPTGTALDVVATATFDMAGFSQSVAGFSGAGTVLDSASSTTSTLTDTAGATTFSGVLENNSGTGGTVALTVNGANLALSGTNTYSGATTVSSGTLATTSSSGFGTSTVSVAAGATLELSGGSVQPANALDLTGTLEDLSGNDGWNGPIVLAASASPQIANPGGGGGDFVVVGTITGGAGSTLTFSATGSIELGSNSYTANTAVTGGNLIGEANNPFGSGTVTVSSGGGVELWGGASANNPLSVAGPGPFGAFGALGTTQGSSTWSGPVTLTGNATLSSAGSDTLTVSGSIGGSFALTTEGPGGTVLLSASNGYTGSTTVSSGTVVSGVANALPTGTALDVASGATFDLAGFAQQVASITSDTGTITDSGAAVGLTVGPLTADDPVGEALTGSLNLVVDGGSYNLIPSGANTYSGSTTVATGRLELTNSSALGATSGVLVDSAADLILDVAGGATYSNPLTLGSGTAPGAVLWGVTSGNTWSGTVTLAASSLGWFTANSSTTLTISGQVTGTGALDTNGTGTVVLANANDNYTGATSAGGASGFTLDVTGTVSASAITVDSGATVEGTGTIDGIASNLGIVAPGSPNTPGILDATGAVNLDGSVGTFAVEVAGTTPGTDYSQLSSTSTVNLGSALLNVTDAYAAPYGTVFTIVSSSGSGTPVSGTFSGDPGGTVITTSGGRKLLVGYAGNAVTLTDVTNPPPPPPPSGPTVSGISPAAGSTGGGTSVTVTGTGFTGATAVAFGGTPAASFKVVS